MKNKKPIKALFVDIGGVLLSDGWGHTSRALAVKTFKLDPAEMEYRHQLVFAAYELGKLTLKEYLDEVVFYQKRPFTRGAFWKFMIAQSEPFPEMIALVGQLKAQYGLKVAVVSNENRELNAYRIHKFKLDGLADFFVSSCFVGLRKPDADIFRLALDLAQTPAAQVAYLENTPMFVRVAAKLGIQSVLHTDYPSTRAKLALLGLGTDEGGV